MSLTRRTLLQSASLLFAAGRRTLASAALDPNLLARFVDPLPLPGIAQSTGTHPVPDRPSISVPYYHVTMQQISSKFHRDLPPARQWSFGATSPGPLFETRSGQGLMIEWVNALPDKHFLPIDHNLAGAEADKPEVRSVVHVHGAKVPPPSDGYPEQWYVPGKSATCYYPNQQDAAMLWYHDHTMGINRLNIYAGLFGLFVIRDGAEDALNLPQGKYEVPLVIYDRLLRQDGQIEYPVSGVEGKPWVPEVFGNAMIVNGKLFPYLDVEPRKYRFRVLNASNGRFLHLSVTGKSDDNLKSHQIGTDQGLLPAPVPVERVLLAPGERADLVIDFSAHSGANLTLQNDAFVVMQLRVAPGKAADPSALPASLRPVPKIPESAAIQTRQLALIENENMVGESMSMLLNRQRWDMPVTENPVLNTTEIWTFINTTDDSHPIHLHLVRFQILDRRRFEPFLYQTKGELRYTGPSTPPEPFEAGWKDTVRADPRMVTRIIVRFEGYTGRYVWHCHVLEHEDNEMMRPYDVLPAG